VEFSFELSFSHNTQHVNLFEAVNQGPILLRFFKVPFEFFKYNACKKGCVWRGGGQNGKVGMENLGAPKMTS
jgi:hypothetical protein